MDLDINIMFYDFSIPEDYRRYLIDNISRKLPTLSDYQLSVILDQVRACQSCVPDFDISLSNSNFKSYAKKKKL